MPDTVNTTDTPDAVALSPVERVVNTFIEPSRTFHDIKRNRSWWLPFVILVVLGWIFCFVAVKHVGWENLATNVLKSQPANAERLDKSTPAQAAQMISFTKGIMEGFMIGTPVMVLLFNAFFALLLWGGFAFLLGGTTTYGEMFAVAIFAALPNALNSIISTVTAIVAEPQTSTNLDLPVHGQSRLLPRHGLPALAHRPGHIARYLLHLVARARRLRRCHRRPGQPARGILLVFVAWLVFVLIKTGIAAA